MLRKRTQYRLLLVAFVYSLIGVAFFAGYAGMRSSFPSPHKVAQNETGYRPPNPSTNGQKPDGIWEQATHDPVALATLLLVLATLLMAAGVFRQIRLAQEEFNASHRPRIRIKHVWLKNSVLDDESLVFELVFTNVGDMPARINKGGIAIRLITNDATLPPDIGYEEFAGSSLPPLGLVVSA